MTVRSGHLFPRLASLATLGLAFVGGPVLPPASLSAAQPPPPPRQPAAVELPPMVIEEAANLPPWLYVRADDTEYLSRCSMGTTRGYVEMRRSRLQWLHTLFPRELFLMMDVPVVTVLTSQKLKQSNNAEVVGAVLDLRKSAKSDGGYTRTTIAPNMMLNDTDIVGVFAYIDEGQFDREKLTISTDYVAFLLDRRTPVLPVWLREGMLAVYNDVIFTETPITLRPLVWMSPEETRRLAKDPTAPRALLSAGEIFASPRRLPLRIGIARPQCALLLRWALDPRNGVRDAFWRFAARAIDEPVSEAMFESCFGFGFSDLRDRLSDYLPIAVRAPLVLPLGKPPALPALDIRRATPTEIARLRGEWERLSVPLVRHRYPQEAGRYLEQARRTLNRAYEAGERDAPLQAILGLCEIDAGNPSAARDFLETAIAGEVVRPRAYYELAKIRWLELSSKEPPEREFSAAETSPILKMLRRGLTQSPALPESFALMAEIWQRSSTTPTDDEVAELKAQGAFFKASPRVCLRAVRALARHGRTPEAVALLGEGFLHVWDDPTRREFAAVYTELTKPK